MAMENDPVIDDFLLFDIVCLLVEWWFSKSQTVSHYQRVDTGPFTSSQDVNGLRRTCGQESPLIPSAIFTLGCHQAWQLEPPCKLRFIAGKIIYRWWFFQCPALFFVLVWKSIFTRITLLIYQFNGWSNHSSAFQLSTSWVPAANARGWRICRRGMAGMAPPSAGGIMGNRVR
jgi:hypothetical protein